MNNVKSPFANFTETVYVWNETSEYWSGKTLGKDYDFMEGDKIYYLPSNETQEEPEKRDGPTYPIIYMTDEELKIWREEHMKEQPKTKKKKGRKNG